MNDARSGELSLRRGEEVNGRNEAFSGKLAFPLPAVQ